MLQHGVLDAGVETPMDGISSGTSDLPRLDLSREILPRMDLGDDD
jgi:hypothetical protein